ncbi:MAG: hypothetical protein ACYTHN_08190 [Planctomycetota bacterium]|jgi:hypothetical protein
MEGLALKAASILCIAGLSCSHDIDPKLKAADAVRSLMRRYENLDFFVPSEPHATSGPTFGSRGSYELNHGFLVLQTPEVISIGDHAVPELLEWLTHKEGYIRFIAAYSLKEITGEDPPYYYFAKEFDPEDDWFKNAVTTWEKWYAKN